MESRVMVESMEEMEKKVEEGGVMVGDRKMMRG